MAEGQLTTFQDCLDTLFDACNHIQDSNALAWSIIDNKSEQAVTAALATAVNRKVGKRVAHIEYKRTDLIFADKCLVDHGNPIAFFEAKAVYLTDFEPKRVAKKDWYLGKCVADDLVKLRKGIPQFSSTLGLAGLFYLYELSDSARMLKYGNRAIPRVDYAIESMQQLAAPAKLIKTKVIDCGEADGTSVKIHVCTFIDQEAIEG